MIVVGSNPISRSCFFGSFRDFDREKAKPGPRFQGPRDPSAGAPSDRSGLVCLSSGQVTNVKIWFWEDMARLRLEFASGLERFAEGDLGLPSNPHLKCTALQRMAC